jgi:hypothetical protein
MWEYSRNLERTDDTATSDLRGAFASDVDAVEDDLSCGGFQELREQVEAGRFARAVGADQCVDGAATHAQVHAVDGGEAFELFCQAASFQNRIAENHVSFRALFEPLFQLQLGALLAHAQ